MSPALHRASSEIGSWKLACAGVASGREADHQSGRPCGKGRREASALGVLVGLCLRVAKNDERTRFDANSARRLSLSLPRRSWRMADGPYDPETGELISRAPEREDIVNLCRELNSRGVRYVIPPEIW